MARRLQQTFADDLVVLVSPALIMTMVGSLVYFLVEVFYQGEYEIRLLYILTLFVFAAVLISRISIEEGREHAMPFGIALAIVVGLALQRFVEFKGSVASYSWAINWGLMALIWWSAHKLTWDCTVVDEGETAPRAGLLQLVGLEKPSQEPAAINSAEPAEPEGTTSRDASLSDWWQRYLEARRRPHAPGVWVIYFSLAALPIFGFGPWFLPVERTANRQYVFCLLCVYVASGLGLLLTTSFLSIRRYLRQRRLEMPAAMAGLWISIGSVLIVTLLLICALLPRPNAEYGISRLPFSVGSPDQHSSPAAVGRDGVKDQQPGQLAQVDHKQPPPANGPTIENPSSPDKAAGEKKDSSASGSDKRNSEPDKATGGDAKSQKTTGSDEKHNAEKTAGKSATSSDKSTKTAESAPKAPESDNKSSDKSADSQPAADEQSKVADDRSKRERANESEPLRPSSAYSRFQPVQAARTVLQEIAERVKYAVYALVVAGLLFYSWTSRESILAGLGRMLGSWSALWASLFGGRRRRDWLTADGEPPRPPPRAFATYTDPFASGTAGKYAPAELVQYTFEAFEAWAREHDCPRGSDQTPLEFARQAGAGSPNLLREAQNLAELYSRVAYADGAVSSERAVRLEQLWQQLRATPFAV